MTAVLEVAGLEKSYGERRVLRGVDLELRAGEVLALLGPNGAGKTTLVSIVAGLRQADAGSVRVAGVEVRRDPRSARRAIGLAPQELGVYPTLTAAENLRLMARLHGLHGRLRREREAWVADALELGPLLGSLAGTLSGGQQRRLHTAMALLHRPRLLLLDEPTVGADVHSREQIVTLVRALAADGAAVCYCTHHLAEVEALGGSAAILDGGEIRVRGPVPELVRAHGESAVRFGFEGAPPPLRLTGRGASEDGSVLRVPTRDPAGDAAQLLGELGEHVRSLRTVEIVQADLESVYRAVVRRAPEAAGEDAEPPA